MAGADEELGIDVKAYFDAMFRSVRAWKGTGSNLTTHLMNWEIRTNNKWKTFYGDTWINGGSGTATDGSLDMAYAVLLAADQWGVSDDGVNYLEYGKGMVDEIWRREVSKNVGTAGTFFTTAGSWQNPTAAGTNYTRPSDHMLHHFKVFAEVDPGNNWQGLIDATYRGQLEVVNQQDVPNGLLPDFIRVNRTTGVWWTQPGRLLETPEDGDYHWNACRVPWRQAMDAMFSLKTPISGPIIELLNANQFAWAGGDFTRIHGRKMDGTANTLENGFSYDVGGSAFSGPALVPAAIYGPQEWFDNGWDWARNYQWRGDKYGDYLTVLAMIAASGNEWSPVFSDDFVVTVESIELVATGKTEYAFGEALDLAGFEIAVVYSKDVYNEDIAVTPAMISGFKANVAGEFTITVTYGGAKTTFTVTVAEPLEVQLLKKHAPTILSRGLSSAQLSLQGKTLTLTLDGLDPIVLSTNANNRNIEGEIDLGNGYFLRFDIKGNGSNMKTFAIILK